MHTLAIIAGLAAAVAGCFYLFMLWAERAMDQFFDHQFGDDGE